MTHPVLCYIHTRGLVRKFVHMGEILSLAGSISQRGTPWGMQQCTKRQAAMEEPKLGPGAALLTFRLARCACCRYAVALPQSWERFPH